MHAVTESNCIRPIGRCIYVSDNESSSNIRSQFEKVIGGTTNPAFHGRNGVTASKLVRSKGRTILPFLQCNKSGIMALSFAAESLLISDIGSRLETLEYG